MYNSRPRYTRENHYANPCAICRISYVLKSQDEHNASYFSKMSWKGEANSSARLAKTSESKAIIGEKLVILQSNTLNNDKRRTAAKAQRYRMG